MSRVEFFYAQDYYALAKQINTWLSRNPTYRVVTITAVSDARALHAYEKVEAHTQP